MLIVLSENFSDQQWIGTTNNFESIEIESAVVIEVIVNHFAPLVQTSILVVKHSANLFFPYPYCFARLNTVLLTLCVCMSKKIVSSGCVSGFVNAPIVNTLIPCIRVKGKRLASMVITENIYRTLMLAFYSNSSKRIAFVWKWLRWRCGFVNASICLEYECFRDVKGETIRSNIIHDAADRNVFIASSISRFVIAMPTGKTCVFQRITWNKPAFYLVVNKYA